MERRWPRLASESPVRPPGPRATGNGSRINHIIKQHATKFIAAAKKEALYPEKHLVKATWSKLDDDWFLLPNPWKVGFTSGYAVGYKDGSTFAMDEYGRRPRHPLYVQNKQQNLEYRTFHNAQREWAKKRIGKPLGRVVDQMGENTVADSLMRDYLVKEGLLPPEEAKPGA